jgi:hypothetical protein
MLPGLISIKGYDLISVSSVAGYAFNGGIAMYGYGGIEASIPPEQLGLSHLNLTAYKCLPGKLILVEKELLGEYQKLTTTPRTVLQGTGRTRQTWELEGWATRTDYETLLGYKLAATANMFVFQSTNQGNAIIWELTGYEKIAVLPATVWYKMVLKEVA